MSEKTDNKKTRHGVPSLTSLSKALNLLLQLREISQPIGLSEISRIIGLKKATVFRLLVTLERYQFVAKNETQKYLIGPNAFYVGSGFLPLNKTEKIQQLMKNIALDCKHTVTLSVLQENSVLFISRIDGIGRIRVTVDIGSRVPAYTSASGKAMLAQFTDTEIRESFRNVKFQRFTPRTISSVDQLISEVALVRSRGFAVNDQETEQGLCALAVVVKNCLEIRDAALSVVYPAGTLGPNERANFVKKLSAAAKEIEALQQQGTNRYFPLHSDRIKAGQYRSERLGRS